MWKINTGSVLIGELFDEAIRNGLTALQVTM